MSTNIPSALHDDADDPELGHYMQIHRLQQLVSELLIENEQLRWIFSIPLLLSEPILCGGVRQPHPVPDRHSQSFGALYPRCIPAAKSALSRPQSAAS
jgi:hypothetical protein